MDKKDYYEVLGVEKTASKHDIKKQFKNLAKLYHPDKETDEAKKAESEDKFKELNEAYSVLSDDEKRKQYDQFGFDLGKNSNNYGDDLDEMFKNFMRTARQNSQQMRPNQHKIAINLTLDELYNGVTKKFNYKVNKICPDCNGNKYKPEDGGKIENCEHCHGTGQIGQRNGNMWFSSTCQNCGGSGKVIINGCKKCNSSGVEVVTETIEITIPKGLPNNGYVIFSGKGNETIINGNKVIGDLIVVVNEITNNKFVRDGDNLHCIIGVDIFDCIIGNDITVDTIDGKTHKFKLTVGTESGNKFRLTGKGMPIMNTESFGDLYVHVKHLMPKQITEEQIDLIKNIKKQINNG